MQLVHDLGVFHVLFVLVVTRHIPLHLKLDIALEILNYRAIQFPSILLLFLHITVNLDHEGLGLVD